MTVGVVMLLHTAFDRAEQVIAHWVNGGCPVVVHVDKKVRETDHATLKDRLSVFGDKVRFSERFNCEWGTWSMVRATQSASAVMLKEFPNVDHVLLSSGACLPLRPTKDLMHFLAQRPGTDFIESATVEDVPWTVDGLDQERFSLFFPFSWRKQRWLFDRFVKLQRALRVNRQTPSQLKPHMGSQWWCLTRKTLTAILEDPNRARFDAYFRHVWIPDESYFQTLARLYSQKIESRSLTLSKFDHHGKPHVFYDDHAALLHKSHCFIARKIWPHADGLYATFLNSTPVKTGLVEPNPGSIGRGFSRSNDLRTKGRPGLFMQSRWTKKEWHEKTSCTKYTVFHGFAEMFEDFEPWLQDHVEARVHGHLFDTERVEFSNRSAHYRGALSDSAALRDYNPRKFLLNLLWNSTEEYQVFQFGPQDRQEIASHLVWDRNATINIVTGTWAIPLFLSGKGYKELRPLAAKLQTTERAFLDELRHPSSAATYKIWSLAEFVETPVDILKQVLEGLKETNQDKMTLTPSFHDLTGFGEFLQDLKNDGMHPYLIGDFQADLPQDKIKPKKRQPYLVK